MLTGHWLLTPYVVFVFFSSIAAYSLHRIIGLQQMHPEKYNERWAKLAALKDLLRVSLWVSIIIAGLSFLQFTFRIQLLLLIPMSMTAGYIIPLGKMGRILRDHNRWKIIWIVFSWIWITVLLPAAAVGFGISAPVWILGLEKGLFILALTLPFDYRDRHIDHAKGLQTVAATLGRRGTQKAALSALTAAAMLSAWAHHLSWFSGLQFWTGIFAYCSSAAALLFLREDRGDYYYSGLLDGLIMLQPILLLIFSLL